LIRLTCKAEGCKQWQRSPMTSTVRLVPHTLLYILLAFIELQVRLGVLELPFSMGHLISVSHSLSSCFFFC